MGKVIRHRPDTLAAMKRAAELKAKLGTNEAVGHEMSLTTETIRRLLYFWKRHQAG